MANLAPFFAKISGPLLALILPAAAWAQPASPSADLADQALYQARYKSMIVGRSENYAPMEAVPGAVHFRPLPTGSDTQIAPQALKDATIYAAANNSKAFLVWHDGALVQTAYFDGAGPDTPLAAKSLAKPLTAIVIGRAIALGYIKSLDQPVSDFITEWRGTPKAAITVRYLLDMRTGLLGQRYATAPDDILNRAYLDPHHGQILIDEYPLTNPPGTRFDYSNATAELVAIVIERATGQRYAQFVSRQVLQPLGANSGSVWIDHPGGLAHSGCCILMPAENFMRMAILLMDDGMWRGRRLLSKDYVAQMRQGTALNPRYGLGIYVTTPYAQRRAFGNPDTPGPRALQSVPFLANDIFMFDGNADQVAYIIPSERLIVLRMGDQPPKSPEWDNAVLPNTILGALTSRAPGAAPQPRPASDNVIH